MKGKILKIFALLFAITGAIFLVKNIIFLLSMTGGRVEVNSIWFDLQLDNKLHIPFIAKALIILLLSVIVWKQCGEFIRREKMARWMFLLLLCVGVAHVVIGIALLLLKEQNHFIYRNGNALGFIVTMTYILLAGLVIRGSLGLINRERKAYWIMGGIFVIAACSAIANIFIVIAYPFLISMKDLLADWYVSLGREAVLSLAISAAALLLLIWLRSEVSEMSDGEDETAGQKSVFKLD